MKNNHRKSKISTLLLLLLLVTMVALVGCAESNDQEEPETEDPAGEPADDEEEPSGEEEPADEEDPVEEEEPAGEATTWEVTKAAEAPALDGDIDAAAWAEATTISLSSEDLLNNGGTSLLGSEESSRTTGEFKLLWSDEGLHLISHVQDDVIDMGAEAGGPFNGQDEVQLVFDPANQKAGTDDIAYIFDFAPVTGAEQDGPAAWFEHWQYGAMDEATGIEVAGSLTDDNGYITQAFIPWDALKKNGEEFEAVAGTEIGFGILVVDFDEGVHKDILLSYGNGDGGNLSNAATFNTIVLSE